MAIENPELVQLALESSPSGILMTNAEGEILLVNKALENLFGYSRAELIGRKVEELIPDRYRGGHSALREGFYADPQTRVMGAGRELYGLRSDGIEVPIEIGLNPVDTQDGIFVLASVVDISARREAEFQLRESQKLEAIGTLASGIAHDFNNILLSILGYTEIVRSQISDGSEIAEDLDQVISGTMRGKKLVERILSYSRHSSRGIESIDPSTVLKEVLDLLRASIPASVSIKAYVEDSVPKVLAEETTLHQLMMNLSTNAVQAMPDGGELKIELTSMLGNDVKSSSATVVPPANKLYTRLRVSDSGVGIPEEEREKIFEAFYTTKGDGQGSGLGLAISHGIVESMNGWIDVDSALGQGTCMDVYLPAMKGNELLQADNAASDIAPKRGHILAVDDEPVLAKLLHRHLIKMGFEVSVFTSSLEALEKFEDDPAKFDMLVTDNTMPDMTGMELVERIRTHSPEFPVLFLSGKFMNGNKDKIANMKKIRALRKPYTVRELQLEMDSVFGD